MDNITRSHLFTNGCKKTESHKAKISNLAEAIIDKQYTIKEVNTDDEEIKEFLFTLGCYKGEEITVISVLTENYVVVVKDARYSIDKELAEAIII